MCYAIAYAKIFPDHCGWIPEEEIWTTFMIRILVKLFFTPSPTESFLMHIFGLEKLILLF